MFGLEFMIRLSTVIHAGTNNTKTGLTNTLRHSAIMQGYFIKTLVQLQAQLNLAIGTLPANTRYRLVEKANPHLVENVGQVEEAGQLHFSKVCKRTL